MSAWKLSIIGLKMQVEICPKNTKPPNFLEGLNKRKTYHIGQYLSSSLAEYTYTTYFKARVSVEKK
jgi:hypothetical protein